MARGDWRETLMRRYADLFGLDGRAAPETASSYPAVGDGWRELVEKAVERIAAAVPAGMNFKITQIKEKLATLRMHFDADRLPDDALSTVREATLLAEMRSACTCEVCGAEGCFYDDDGWLKTRCAAHAAGAPIPAQPGYKHLLLEFTLTDGRLTISTCRRYDRARDCFVDAPPPPDWKVTDMARSSISTAKAHLDTQEPVLTGDVTQQT